MTDVGFVIAAYGVILGGLGLYVATLLRRLAAARETSLRIRRQADAEARDEGR
jgi:tRNA A37 N6-isopentenylltransferase MiaA